MSPEASCMHQHFTLQAQVCWQRECFLVHTHTTGARFGFDVLTVTLTCSLSNSAVAFSLADTWTLRQRTLLLSRCCCCCLSVISQSCQVTYWLSWWASRSLLLSFAFCFFLVHSLASCSLLFLLRAAAGTNNTCCQQAQVMPEIWMHTSKQQVCERSLELRVLAHAHPHPTTRLNFHSNCSSPTHTHTESSEQRTRFSCKRSLSSCYRDDKQQQQQQRWERLISLRPFNPRTQVWAQRRVSARPLSLQAKAQAPVAVFSLLLQQPHTSKRHNSFESGAKQSNYNFRGCCSLIDALFVRRRRLLEHES